MICEMTEKKLPAGWRWAKLGDVCALVGDSINPQAFKDELFAHYSIPAFDNRSRPVIETGENILSNKYTFPRGTVLFSKLNPRISRVWHVDDEHRYRRICSTEFLPLLPDTRFLFPESLLFLLQEPSMVERLRAGVSAATKSRERLSPDQVMAETIPLPPLPEQKRIAAVLAKMMAAIEKARAGAEGRLEAAKALPTAYLRGVFESDEAKGWPRERVRDFLCSPLNTGISKPASPASNIDCLTLSSVRNGVLDLNARKSVAVTPKEAVRNWVKPGAFYVVRGNGNLSLVGRGAIAPAPLELNVLFPDLLIEVNSNPQKVIPEFLSVVWNTKEVRSQIEAVARTSAGIYKINLQNLGNISIPVPGVDRQRLIVKTVSSRANETSILVDKVWEETVAIKSLPAALLRQAFSGEL